jgi:sugar transferase (PEP-CTERM/EpsH1 system associated)
MQDLLFLAHRIPYPPNKGDKLRSFHLLRHLARSFRVHLGCFIDDPDDWQHVEATRQLCAATCFVGLRPGHARFRSLGSFLRKEALTLGYYRDVRMTRWVNHLLAQQRIHHILVFSSAMAQYVLGCANVVRVADLVDVDSAKWGQLAAKVPRPLSWVYRRESRTLLRFESQIASSFDATVFVSSAEEDLFRRLSGIRADGVCHAANGVDAAYFSPDVDLPNPFPGGTRNVVFTGAMDYRPNVEAVSWFAREVFPALRSRWPDSCFVVVGARPTADVLKLSEVVGITVTGTVPDVRPYIKHAEVIVAPLQLARGVQNKVLEGMAMAKTVVASPEAAEGIDAISGTELAIAASPREYLGSIGAVFEGRLNLGRHARERILDSYAWENNLRRISMLLVQGEDLRAIPQPGHSIDAA